MTQLPPRWQRSAARPLVLGHRGVRQVVPENTLAAFEQARSEGADGVELDVQLSHDGVPFVVHDLDLHRVTEGGEPRRVRELSSAELDSVLLPGGHPVPRLETILRWAVEHDRLLNIELKTHAARRDSVAEKVAELLRSVPESWPTLLVSSFHPTLLSRFKAALPEVPTALLFSVHHAQWAARGWARKLGTVALHPDARCFLLAAPRPRPPGVLLNTWTVNDRVAAQRLARLGVDAIITDTPARILAALAPQDTQELSAAP